MFCPIWIISFITHADSDINALNTCMKWRCSGIFWNSPQKTPISPMLRNITQLCACKHDENLIYEKYLFSVNFVNLSSGILNTKNEEISSLVRLPSLRILLSWWKCSGLIIPLLLEYVTLCSNIKRAQLFIFIDWGRWRQR